MLAGYKINHFRKSTLKSKTSGFCMLCHGPRGERFWVHPGLALRDGKDSQGLRVFPSPVRAAEGQDWGHGQRMLAGEGALKHLVLL